MDAYNQSIPEASSDEVFEVDVVLIDGRVIPNYSILLFNTVTEEKCRIWNRENQQGPPALDQVVLILLGEQGAQTILNQEKRFREYINELTSSKVKFELLRNVKEIEARASNPAALNTSLKESSI